MALLRMVLLISSYAMYCLLLSQVVPFDARDNMVLLRLELLSMYVQLVLGIAFVVKSEWNPLLYRAPGEVVELPLLLAHGLFGLAVIQQLLTNVVPRPWARENGPRTLKGHGFRMAFGGFCLIKRPLGASGFIFESRGAEADQVCGGRGGVDAPAAAAVPDLGRGE